MKKTDAKIFIKEGRRYYPIHGDGYLCADGVWLVELNGRNNSSSRRQVVKLEDLPKFNTQEYLGLQHNDHDDLCKFLNLRRYMHIISNMKIDDAGMVHWSEMSNSEFASEILKFLSLNETDRKEYINHFEDQLSLGKHWRGYGHVLRDQRGIERVKISPNETLIFSDAEKLDSVYLEKQYKEHKRALEILEQAINFRTNKL